MATSTSVPPNTPTGAGFQNPNFSGHGSQDARIIIYGYTPSLALCVVAIILYAITLVLHVFQVTKYKLWSFAPLSFGCLLETVGYIFRTLSSQQDPYNSTWFVIQYFFIVVAPVFISASIYVCITKLIAWAQVEGYDVDSRRWLKPKWILWGFITTDIVTTIMQIAGAALVGSSESNYKDPSTGNNILLAGLALQTFTFTVFLFQLVCLRISFGRDMVLGAVVRKKDPFIVAIFATSILVYLRTVFRLAETAEGVFGSVSTNETLFGALEFAPVVLALWIVAFWHPGRWLPRGTASTRSVPSRQSAMQEA